MASTQAADAKGQPAYCEFHRDMDGNVVGRVYARKADPNNMLRHDHLVEEKEFNGDDAISASRAWASAVMDSIGSTH